ncbi:MAG: hypothetical protein AABX79_00465 [Nanoarchaeota archaeon]
MVQNPEDIKERILSSLKLKGPSLPVHIAGEIKSSILFSSAFLGELVSEKKVRMSHMKVGSSRLYLLPGQESNLENFSQHLRSKEKEAFLLLKEKRFLRDSAQNPAIRVALREIRDFAVPFKQGEEVIWRYFLVPETEFKTIEEKQKPMEIEAKKPVPVKIAEKPLDILGKGEKEQEEAKPREIIGKIKRPKKKISVKKTPKKDDKFFLDIKEFLSANSIELVDMQNFEKGKITLKIKDNGEEKLLVAYNKNKITEDDIIRASKKASKEGIPYIILGLGDPSKKIGSLIDALKGLSSIKKMK